MPYKTTEHRHNGAWLGAGGRAGDGQLAPQTERLTPPRAQRVSSHVPDSSSSDPNPPCEHGRKADMCASQRALAGLSCISYGANDGCKYVALWSSASWPACWHGGNDIVVAVTIEVLLLGRAESGYFLAAICLFPELATVLVVGLCSQDLRRAMARCAPLSQRFRTLGDWIIAYLESCARLSIDFTVIFVMNHEIAHVTPIFLRLRRALVFPIWHLSATPYRSTTPYPPARSAAEFLLADAKL